MESLFIQLSDFSIKSKLHPYDWFCGPGSHMILCDAHNGFAVKEVCRVFLEMDEHILDTNFKLISHLMTFSHK